jgi:hypothetical protein
MQLGQTPIPEESKMNSLVGLEPSVAAADAECRIGNDSGDAGRVKGYRLVGTFRGGGVAGGVGLRIHSAAKHGAGAEVVEPNTDGIEVIC